LARPPLKGEREHGDSRKKRSGITGRKPCLGQIPLVSEKKL